MADVKPYTKIKSHENKYNFENIIKKYTSMRILMYNCIVWSKCRFHKFTKSSYVIKS